MVIIIRYGVVPMVAPPNLDCSPVGLVHSERFAIPLKCEKHRISQIFSVLQRPSALGCGATSTILSGL